ncbi:MAG: hypothetical protein WCO09_01500 [bacterium]
MESSKNLDRLNNFVTELLRIDVLPKEDRYTAYDQLFTSGLEALDFPIPSFSYHDLTKRYVRTRRFAYENASEDIRLVIVLTTGHSDALYVSGRLGSKQLAFFRGEGRVPR